MVRRFLPAGGGGHVFGFGEVSAEGPFREDMLAGGEGGENHFVVKGDPDGHGDDVEIRLVDHLAVVVEVVGGLRSIRRLIWRFRACWCRGRRFRIRGGLEGRGSGRVRPSRRLGWRR